MNFQPSFFVLCLCVGGISTDADPNDHSCQRRLHVDMGDDNSLKALEAVIEEMTSTGDIVSIDTYITTENFKTTTAAMSNCQTSTVAPAVHVCEDMMAKIPNCSISASSNYTSDTHMAFQARLDNRRSWSAKQNRAGEWLQVDFGKVIGILGVITQGRQHDEWRQWVKSYKVSCDNTSQGLKFVQENGIDKIFQGNTDRNTKVSNYFPRRFSCRFMRVYPQTWSGHISMRVGFITCVCKADKVAEIPDSSITASSFHEVPSLAPQQARLDGQRSWSAATNQIGQWIQVDFGQVKQIYGVITQGRQDCCNQWVSSYKVSCGETTQGLQFVRENNIDKVFSGNSNPNSKVSNYFSGPRSCRAIRFYPQTWNGHMSMRVGFITCVCKEDNLAGISDSSISASSFHDSNLAPTQARLNGWRSWSARTNQVGEWLQVNFGKVEKIYGVITQGRKGCCNQWVTSYKVSCGNTTQELKVVQERGNDMVFPGNRNRNTKVFNYFPKLLYCKIMRFYPQTWNEHMSMRAGVITCACNEDKMSEIPDSSITASSFWSRTDNLAPQKARLDGHESWSAKTNQIGEWLQVDFGEVERISGVKTRGRQGCDNCNQWVATYTVSCGKTIQELEFIQDNGVDMVFQGNTDNNTVVSNRFTSVHSCRFMRIYPQTWHNYISMKAGFICAEDSTTTSSTETLT